MALFKYLNGERVELSAEEEAQLKAAEDAVRLAAPAKAFVSLRKERNQRLAATDHYALKDLTLTAGMRDYRAALRSFPEQFDDSSILGEITWPAKPE